MSILNFLESDSSYHLVNSSYAKTGGGRFQIFYIYQKKDEIIVFREYLCISGLVDSEVVFKGNVFNTIEDKVNKSSQSKSTPKENKVMVFISNYNSNDRVELMFNGNDVILMKYENNMRTMSVKGKFFNNDLIMDDGYYYYTLTGDELCFGAEGVDECFNKVSERTNGAESNSNQSQTSNSLSDIRGQVISGNIRNMKRQLREPDEVLSADDFMLKYHNWKPFSVYSSQRLLYSVIYVYENICDRPIIVIYNSNNAKVFEVMYKDDVTSFEDLAVDYGYD